MPHREQFDPKRSLVAARTFTFAGVRYDKGDPFPSPEAAPAASFPRRLIERQYNTMAVNHAPEASDEPTELVQIAPAKRNGSYDITAPWLEKPLTIRGKVNAEKALAEMREEGPPLGWIEGGSEVEIEEHGGGWYEITAPWLDEAEKVQGREAAEARQREIHDAGRPEAEGGETPPEGADAGEGGQQASETNPANAESEQAASGAADDQPGPDDAEQGDDADKAAQAGAGEAAAAEAGKSDDDPATA